MNKKNYLFAFLTVFIWATMAAVVKLMLAEIPSLQALSLSSIFAFLFMLILNAATGKLKLLKQYNWKDILKMASLGFLGLFLYSALYYYGLTLLSSQEACIINYLWPIMVLIFSCIILKEPLNARKIIAMACSFAGIILLSLVGGDLSSKNKILGICVCLLAAVCYGLFSVLNKKANYDQNITMMIVWFTVAICAGVLGWLTEKWIPIHGLQWAGLLWLGIVIDAVAYLTWALALNRAKNTARIANLAYLTPFLSLVISALVLKEKITISALAALVLIIGGILIQNISLKKIFKSKN